MSADIILFVPRSNIKAGCSFPQYPNARELAPIEQMAIEIMNQTGAAHSEYVAPQNDPA